MAPVKVHFPDFLENWPHKRVLNPHYKAAKAETREWIHSFGRFEGKGLDAFDRCDFGEDLLVKSPNS